MPRAADACVAVVDGNWLPIANLMMPRLARIGESLWSCPSRLPPLEEGRGCPCAVFCRVLVHSTWRGDTCDSGLADVITCCYLVRGI